MGRTDWEIYDEALPFAGTRYSPQRVRMAVVGLGGRDLLAVSPGGNLDDAQWQKLEGWGTPSFLLAPNHFHNGGLAEWKKRFPASRIVAHGRALPRLQRKLPGLTIEDLSVLEAELPDHVRVLSPPTATQGETIVSITTSYGTAWFVTDAIVNETKLSGVVGIVSRVIGFRTRLMTNPLFKRIFLKDRPAYKTWMLAQIARDTPTLFVPSHGAAIRGPDVTEQLRKITEEA